MTNFVYITNMTHIFYNPGHDRQ